MAGVDGRIILKWILKKCDGRGVSWIDVAGSCECGSEHLGCINAGNFLTS